MTWKPALFAALALLALTPAAAQEDILPQTETIVLDPANPEREEFGELLFRGGLAIEPGEEEVGGISGLEWHDDKLYAVSDDGRWLTITTDEINARLIDIYSISMGPLLDERGRRLRSKENVDAEAIARIPDDEEGWAVAFERRHRIWGYFDFGSPDYDDPAEVLAEPINQRLPPAEPNKGIETIDFFANGEFACVERYVPGEPNCLIIYEDRDETFELAPPEELAEHDGAPTDAACLADGTCFVLFRSYRSGVGNRAAIVKHTANTAETTTIATFLPPLTLDNFEGLAVREQYGKTYLYVVSDNNFSDNQRTLLLKFEIKAEAAPPQPIVAKAPEPVVEYETQDVVLVTELGDITIRLETERAPITAANFLRYVDEDRFDGTVFYRAMKLNREPSPNGLIQGGTQFDPKRILPGIPHEPTTQTGLSHTHGALSMAMGDPGTANGDFSIMLQDQIGLDARPDAAEAIWQNGYAVFGYVIDGMDVVYAIHAMPADPNKGEGAMRGQLLADPVEIIDARRVPAAD